MRRVSSVIQRLIGVALLISLIVGLVGLFSSLSRLPTGAPALPTGTPVVEPTLVLTAEVVQPQPVARTPTNPPAPQSRPAGILYESAGNLYWQPVDAQGKALAAATRLSIDRADDEKIITLSRSPNGKEVLFAKVNPNTESEVLYVFMPPTGDPRPLLGGVSLGLGTKLFGWHPNSQQIVYWDGEKIWLRDVYSDRQTLVVDPRELARLSYQPQVEGVAFSPDGKKVIIAFTLSGQSWEVWTVNVDGSDSRSLLKTEYPIFAIAWSPDGKTIAFASGTKVEVMNPDGQDRRAVGTNFIGGASPGWSPDSHYIAFTAQEASSYKVRIVDVASGKERNLRDQTGKSDVLPTWSPDGSQLLFLSDWVDERGGSEVWAIGLDGTNLQQLTSDGQPKRSAPLWLPTVGGDQDVQ